MKSLLISLIAIFTIHAHAHHTENHELPSFESCERVSMAFLNKRNQPYWVPQSVNNTLDIQSCYKDLQVFAQKATPKMINVFESEFQGQIRIFDNDEDFANFINENDPSFTPEALVTPVTFEVNTPAITTDTAKLFEGLFE